MGHISEGQEPCPDSSPMPLKSGAKVPGDSGRPDDPPTNFAQQKKKTIITRQVALSRHLGPEMSGPDGSVELCGLFSRLDLEQGASKSGLPLLQMSVSAQMQDLVARTGTGERQSFLEC
jgi:hypothetical protein